MHARGPDKVGRAGETDPTLLRFASAITEQKICWELLAQKFDRLQTLRLGLTDQFFGPDIESGQKGHPAQKACCFSNVDVSFLCNTLFLILKPP